MLILLQDVPSNWVLTKVSPRLWLAFLMFSWGAVLCGMAFTNSWQVLAFCRFLLGAFEGGVLPGVAFVIACWCVWFYKHSLDYADMMKVYQARAAQANRLCLRSWTGVVCIRWHTFLRDRSTGRREGNVRMEMDLLGEPTVQHPPAIY